MARIYLAREVVVGTFVVSGKSAMLKLFPLAWQVPARGRRPGPVRYLESDRLIGAATLSAPYHSGTGSKRESRRSVATLPTALRHHVGQAPVGGDVSHLHHPAEREAGAAAAAAFHLQPPSNEITNAGGERIGWESGCHPTVLTPLERARHR